MAEQIAPFAFINYRREDTAGVARYIFEMIGKRFGAERVFLDVEGIESGMEWPARIRNQLARSTVVISIIGTHWLTVTDKYGRRRIDKPDDWVRQELVYALNHCDVIPALLLDTPIPEKDALDDPELAKLRSLQVCRLHDYSWHDDLIRLMKRLENMGFEQRLEHPVLYPPPKLTIREIAARELINELTTLPGWSAQPNERGGSDLFKNYEFASFEDAMAFMQEASIHIAKAQHHPTWTNVWRTVSIWLSTWDIGSRISPIDIDLARYFENLRNKWAPSSAS